MAALGTSPRSIPPDSAPFSDVIEMLEAFGWELTGIWPPYRIFRRPGSRELPLLVEVQPHGGVRHEHVEYLWQTARAA